MALNFLNDGYFAGSVGIGTESPSRNLQVKGTTNTAIAITSSTSTLAQLALGDTDDDNYAQIILDNSTNKLQIQNGGGGIISNRGITLDSSENVGIGTNSPDNILHIRKGDTTYASQVGADTMLFLETTNVSNALQFTSANTGQQYIMFGDDDPNVGWISYNHSDNNLNFRVNALERMRIDSSGNVNLATGRLRIALGSDEGSQLNLWADSNGFCFIAGYDLEIKTGSNNARSTRVKIKHTGEVGIGTVSPTSQLSIGSNAITTKKPTVIIADEVAGGSLVIRGLSPILSFDRTGANPENKILMDGAGLEFKTGTLDTEGDVDFKIKLDGKLQAPAYTQGFLQSDASGNIEISGGGTLPGGPYLPLSAGASYPLTGRLDLTSAGGTGIRIVTGDTSEGYLIFGDAADNSMGGISYNNNTNTLSIDCNNSERITILSTGNVGIGTTSPDRELEVEGAGNVYIRVTSRTDNDSTALELKNTQETWTIRNDDTNDDALEFQSDSGTQVTILKAGNVGIGTTSPDDILDVVDGNAQMVFGTASSDRTYMQFKHNAVPVDGEELCLMDFSGYNDASQDTRYVILTTKAEDVTDGSEDGSLTIQTMKDGTATQSMTLRSGNVGIGTTSPGYKLSVSGGINAGGVVTYSKSAGSLDTTGYAIAGLGTVFNGASAFFTFTASGGTGQYQRVVYSCAGVGTNWVVYKVIDEGTNVLDIEASATSAATIVFTFKTRSGTQAYSPRVVIQATGHSIISTYA